MKDYAEAIRCYEKAENKFGILVALHDKAISLGEAKRFEEAPKSLRDEAIKNEPNDAYLWCLAKPENSNNLERSDEAISSRSCSARC